MTQRFKTIYFSDYPAMNSKQKSLTVAFGKNSQDVYNQVKDLSSEEVRRLLGMEKYRDVDSSANENELTINNFCLRQLKKSLEKLRQDTGQITIPDIEDDRQLFDPITVTFKGGAKEPFVRWYPYLEGYSTKFVEAILSKYSPNAKKILDPFAGTGTTVFTCSRLQMESFYCEINPVLQFITQTKILVRSMSINKRLEIAEELTYYKNNLATINDCKPDNCLNSAYKDVFSDSEFFEKKVYTQILKLRSWLDKISLSYPIASDLLNIAVISVIIPASNMKRAGDLRYKTQKEKENSKCNLLDILRLKIQQIADDLKNDSNGLLVEPTLISESAASVDKLPFLGIDTIITSPPYVNGTNYFRNTKIELWFLRCLKEKNDLSKFRREALTAGINDVSLHNEPSRVHPDVEDIVHKLEDVAYDARIPKMIASYFSEITDVFEKVTKHLKHNATIAIDIGDSCYAGIHVPVEDLLTSCLDSIGYSLKDKVTLRRRKSRGGMLLKQSLLVYKYPIKKNNCNRKDPNNWKKEWGHFKRDLPHQALPFSKRNWGHNWHSLCSYPGKLKPSIANQLVNIFVPPNGTLLDPFAGAGTIPFEGSLQGKLSYGFEISPAAYYIAKAKLRKPDINKCLKAIDLLGKYIKNNSSTVDESSEAKSFGYNGKIAEYYENQTLEEIILARRYFTIHRPQAPEETFLMACLLHILHGNRPYALSRRSHPLTPYKPSGSFQYKSLTRHLRDKVTRSLQHGLPNDYVPGKILLHDATKWWPREIQNLDAIITSPPFYDSTRFYSANWIRLWFAGWSSKDFKTRPKAFVDEKQKISFDIYTPILRQARERLAANGVVVLHLGKSKKCDMAANLIKTAKKWFNNYDLFDESVTHCEKHGIRDKGSVTSHQYLVLY